MKTMKELVVEYVENNLSQELTVASVSKHFNFSMYHFHRRFQSWTGMQLGEYIRRSRLNHAAALINDTDMKIIDIAEALGYETPESFSRAYRKAFGVTPSRYRKGYTVFETVKETTDRMMDNAGYKILELEPLSIAGLVTRTSWRQSMSFREIPLLWKRFYQEGHSGRLVDYRIGTHAIGLCTDYDEAGFFTYCAAYPVKSIEGLPEGLFCTWLPGGLYAMLTVFCEDQNCMGKRIGTATDQFCFTLPSSFGYRPTYGPNFDIYYEARDGQGGYEVEVYIPIEKTERKE